MCTIDVLYGNCIDKNVNNAKRIHMDNNTETLYGMENDMVLLQFLRSKNSDRFTKLDAFCDLIGRMSEQSRHHDGSRSASFSPLCHGQFTGSISQLAHDWHWHRATVRSFLDGLETRGVIKRDLHGRDYTFRLRTHASLAVPIVTYDTVLDIAYYLLRHWDEYSLTPEFLAAYFEAYDGCMMNTDIHEDNPMVLAVDNAKIILHALGHLEFSVIREARFDDSVVQKVAATFMGEEKWSWVKWMKALMFLDTALIAFDFPVKYINDVEERKHDAFISDFTDQDMSLLQELFNQVKKEEEKFIASADTEDNTSSSPTL